jgi:hypothetical protein
LSINGGDDFFMFAKTTPLRTLNLKSAPSKGSTAYSIGPNNVKRWSRLVSVFISTVAIKKKSLGENNALKDGHFFITLHNF